MGQKTYSLYELLTPLVIPENAFQRRFQEQPAVSIIHGENRFFGPGGLQHHVSFIFDEKQHPKKIWFRGY